VSTGRAEVEQLLAALPHQEAIRPENGEVSFSTAWEIRAFALAVAAHQGGQYAWEEFQHALTTSIRVWEESGTAEPWRYYDRWVEALEMVLADTGTLEVSEVDDRTRVVLQTPRNANHHHARREPVTVDAGGR
jgi:nitrile hydratase accessory protein